MTSRTSRWLLAVSALLHLSGAVAHATAFPRTAVALAGAHLSAHYIGMFKSLFLADSTTLTVVGAALVFLFFRPAAASRGVVVALALVSTATATTIFVFMGGFFAGYWMLAAGASAMLAAAV